MNIKSWVDKVNVRFGGFIAVAQAQTSGTVTAPTNIISNSSQVVNLLCGGLNWMFWGLIVLSIAMALTAAYMYATSNGDAEKVSKAGKTLTYVAIAVVVAVVAKSMPLIIGDLLKVPGSLNACQ